ncbi:MAG: response regulator [Saprospiraceae bacterium]|nr:response regulator [Saprospiraceae bacterium]
MVINFLMTSISLIFLPIEPLAQPQFPPLPAHLSETGYPLISTYEPDDYLAFDQNFAICQDSLGILYFANLDGALVFDGANWQLIPLSNFGNTYAIDCGKDQRVYVGGTEEVGYLSADSSGNMSFQSIRRLLPVETRLGTVRKIISTSHHVYFHNSQSLFIYSGDTIKVQNFASKIADIFLVKGKIYISLAELGIVALTEDTTSKFVDYKRHGDYITLFLPRSDNTYLIGTNNGDFFEFNGVDLEPWPTQVNTYLKNQKLKGGILLTDSSYALATRYGGIVILDSRGRQLVILNNNRVLPSQKIFSLFQDSGGMLWAGMDYGISKIEYPSRFSVLDQKSLLDGVVSKVIKHQGTLYISTEYGISQFIPGTIGRGPRVEPVFETKDFVDDMLSFQNLLLFTTHLGIFSLEGKTVKKLTSNFVANSLCRSSIDKRRIFSGHHNGLRSFFYDGNLFKDEGPIGGLTGNIFGIVELPNGELWLETDLNKIYKVVFYIPGTTTPLTHPTVEVFSTEQGLPNAVGRLFSLDEQLYFREIYGDNMYILDRTSMIFRRDTTLRNQLALEREEIKVRYIDQVGNIWFDQYGSPDTEGTFVGWKKDHGKYLVHNLRENRIFDLAGKNQFYDPENNIMWRVGKKKVFRHNLNISPKSKVDFHTIIRSVTYRDSIIRASHNAVNQISTLPFKNNRFRFQYTCPLFTQGRAIQFQTLLEGHEDTWSIWRTENTKDFSNLPEGDYTFRVRAKNMFGQPASEASFSFRISPPWHRSWWAYILYILAGIFGTGAIVRWRSNQLKREKQVLQQVVLARTSELQVQNQQLEKQKQKLALQTEQLQEMDQLKSRLFANISHEFRTPLTLIKGPLDQMERFPNSRLSTAHFQMMQRNTDRLLRLVNQLLDLSKLDAGSLKINATEGNVFHWIRMVASSFSSLAAERNLDYRMKIPGRNLWAAFDRDKIEKIVYNLLSNAFKFTQHQGSITIETLFVDDTLHITVRDTGVGIPAHQLEKVFGRFYQVDDSHTKNQEGSGIGLALVKELVELLEGNIHVESEPNKGTNFYIILPLKEIKAPTTKKERLLQELDQKLPLAAIAKAKEKTAENTANKISVLLVEDNPDMRTYVAEILAGDYSINLAKTGQEGLEKATKLIPDLVVTDLMMPEMDGLQLCKILKTDERTSHIPVIILTAKAGLENRLTGLETGADSYLTKPFNAQELQIRVKNLISERHKLRKIFSTIDHLSPKEINWPTLDQEFLQKVLDLLEARHSQSAFGVPQMQKELGMSKTQLHRKLKAITNQAPGEFLRNFRLKRAAQILSTGESATQTAYGVGFSNLSYFAKCFKALHGVSPKEYRSSAPEYN